MDFGAVSWLGVLVAGVVFFIVGGLWFGLLFGKLWLRLSGRSVDDPPPSNLALMFVLTGVLGLVAALGLAAVSGADASAGAGLVLGIGAAALVVAPVVAILHIYDRKPAGLLALNIGYILVGFAAMGAIIGAFQ